jgi:cytochrome c553
MKASPRAHTAAVLGLAAAAITLLAGCANTTRSRNLADPAVPAVALAQQVCANCHGLHGQAVSPNFPNLAGQPAEYLAVQLKAFRDHTRQEPPAEAYMWGIARSLSDAQIEDLASYYAGQPASSRNTP